MTSPCTATYNASLGFGRSPVPVTCFRNDAGHVDDGIGEHQGYEQVESANGPWRRLWTWSESGAQGAARQGQCLDCIESSNFRGAKSHSRDDHKYLPCVTCATLYDTAEAEPGRCLTCFVWDERAAAYAVGAPVGRRGTTFLRTDDSDLLYSWQPGSVGGFGGRRYKVTLTRSDGEQTVLGPADSLWSSGLIPLWRRHQFPPNAVIEAAERIARAGHVTPSGTPMEFTGAPLP